MIRIAGVLLLLVVGCASAPPTPASVPSTELVAQGHGDRAIRDAVVRALTRRRFQTEMEQPGRIVAQWGREISFRIAIEWNDRQYTVHYLDSTGLDNTVDPLSGELLVDGRYSRWRSGLMRTIADEIDRPARERAAAVTAQRQHELAVAQSRENAARAQAHAAETNAHAQRQARRNAVLSLASEVVQRAPQPRRTAQPRQVTYSRSHQQASATRVACINSSRYTCPSETAFQECMVNGYCGQCQSAGRCE